jgi:uncharacterized protein YrzB (UPF0473 family)
VYRKLERLASKLLTMRNLDYAKEKIYLNEAVSKEDSRIKILSEQREKEECTVQREDGSRRPTCGRRRLLI